jgi:predicted small lipoprotein YifL
MTKLLVIALTSAALMLSLSGCGYKAPPFYEKPTSDKGTTVAL